MPEHDGALRASRRFHAEPIEQRRGRMAVWLHAEFDLHFADGIPEIEVDMALEIVHVIAETCELALQGDPRVA
jgi:hypothetical protein